jgi:hypothetical protein
MKRIVIATAFGLVAGLLCAAGGLSMGVKITALSFIWILLNRMLLGFVIGISTLRLHWALHGALLAVIVGSLFSYNAIMSGAGGVLALATFAGSIVFGVMIEFFTTVVFKQPAWSPETQTRAARIGG